MMLQVFELRLRLTLQTIFVQRIEVICAYTNTTTLNYDFKTNPKMHSEVVVTKEGFLHLFVRVASGFVLVFQLFFALSI